MIDCICISCPVPKHFRWVSSHLGCFMSCSGCHYFAKAWPPYRQVSYSYICYGCICIHLKPIICSIQTIQVFYIWSHPLLASSYACVYIFFSISLYSLHTSGFYNCAEFKLNCIYLCICIFILIYYIKNAVYNFAPQTSAVYEVLHVGF